jgi:hypothetical protein
MWRPTGEEIPVERILELLGATIGLPYLLLSATGPLLQEDFRRQTGRTPYRLYSLSNIGSLLALLSYPFLFEPQLTLRMQIVGWSSAYVVFVLFCGGCALAFTRPAHAGALAAERVAAGQFDAARPTGRDILLWLALAACGSVMLLATTNQLCQEVFSVPFLWVVPLALYLFTFILCFDHPRWYHRGTFLVLLTVAVPLACAANVMGNKLGMRTQIAAYSLTLWVCCMVCHGELTRAKPAPHFATLFYLMVAAGGALGGILVALVAPLVLPDFWEYQIGLIATILLAFAPMSVRSGRRFRMPHPGWIVGGVVCVVVGLLLGAGILRQKGLAGAERTIETARNFYGVLRVKEKDDIRDDNGPGRELVNGRIQHGFQYLDPQKRRWPTTYYGPLSGIGRALEHHPRRAADDPAAGTLRIGVVGLGCGTLAAYGQQGDTVRFYEINPQVLRIAKEYFTYLDDTPAHVDVVMGDARIKMEQEIAAGEPQQFDVLAIDAFSSDSIPMHLLTLQCVELFQKHLRPDGLLCVHISNRFLDLSGVVFGIAQELGYECVLVNGDADDARGIDYTTWAILTVNWDFLNSPEIRDAIEPCSPKGGKTLVWTDDYGSLWQVLD